MTIDEAVTLIREHIKNKLEMERFEFTPTAAAEAELNAEAQRVIDALTWLANQARR